ncbi:MAG: hypothetical protein J5874_00375 [Oscillospiraceae bacterium]|nr:hypothetical protein [Oscillospiraceae bacterium]
MILDNLTEDEKYFVAMVNDRLRDAEEGKGTRFAGFLDGRRREIAKTVIDRKGYGRYMFYGGYDGAEREYLGIFPEYTEPDKDEFPISAVTCSYRKADMLSHRDFLGALTGLGIKRESIGDILVGEEKCVIFLSDLAAKVVENELRKVGRAGVRTESGITSELPEGEKFGEISGTVASLRIDCIVSMLIGASREKASEKIRSGCVFRNYEEVLKVSDEVSVGDVISIRGNGKYVLSESCGETKKGRIKIKVKKYL